MLLSHYKSACKLDRMLHVDLILTLEKITFNIADHAAYPLSWKRPIEPLPCLQYIVAVMEITSLFIVLIGPESRKGVFMG